MRVLALLVLLVFFQGCLVRSYTVERPRVDLDMEGNLGYLIGSPKKDLENKNKLSDTRKISVVEVELGKHDNAKALNEKEKDASYEEPASWEFDKKEAKGSVTKVSGPTDFNSKVSEYEEEEYK